MELRTILSLLTLSCIDIFTCEGSTVKFNRDIKSVVEELIRKVESSQNKRDTPYIPPALWEKRKGMWESDVKFYFHGKEEIFLLREAFSVYDNNMFATTWIASCLLEAYKYGGTSAPPEDTITAAIMSIKDYQNKNVPYTNSLMTFWPQVYNSTYKTWVSFPKNIHHLFDIADDVNFNFFAKILEDIGLEDVAKIVEKLLAIKDLLLKAFMIPPDFDDSFVNIGLGSLLTQLQTDFPEAHKQWVNQNKNVTSVFDALKKYAYRPMSSDLNVNTIDTRTYFCIRFYLEEAKRRGEDIALVPTWIQNIEEAFTIGQRGVDMPFNINNVDVTVAANSVYGMTSSILNNVIDISILNDPDIQKIYLNTSSLIAMMIKTNFTSRPDMALLYYPSAIEFYWFVARTYGELEMRAQSGPLPHPIFKQVKDILDEALHKYMTQDVLKQTKQDRDGNVYVDDFLGDGDLDSKNKTVVRGQDRLFTTGMAINALLSTWTTFDLNSRKLIWQKETPVEVKETVTKAVNFVQTNILGREYQPWNAFFSGSVKGNTTFPLYPANRENKTLESFQGMEGVITEAEYQSMLKSRRSPLDFHGYNNYEDFFPFWSSEPYTYVTNMLALAKFSNTYEADDLETNTT